MYEALKPLVTAFVLPPGGPIVLVLLGAALWRIRPRLARALCIAGGSTLWLASMPIVAAALVVALGGGTPVDMAAARKAGAIVVLGGGVRRQAPDYGGDTLGRLTLERTRYGARLARATGLPVLVTGGSPKAGVRPEADLMREALAAEFGITARWVDDQARSTSENARNTARILSAAGVREIVLVMHGFDVRRAQRLFERAGLQVVPAPTDVVRWSETGTGDFLPNPVALVRSHFAAYEAIALARDRLLRSE
jgi:uncharacterized SAM-binding protein YcdF (DUF218 family)